MMDHRIVVSEEVCKRFFKWAKLDKGFDVLGVNYGLAFQGYRFWIDEKLIRDLKLVR